MLRKARNAALWTYLHYLRYLNYFGWRGIPIAIAANLGSPGRTYAVPLPGKGTGACSIRLGTTDIDVFGEVLLHREYEIDLCSEPRVIIDAGANIGLASIFFAQKYPGAKILAIEPERGNFELLVENTRRFPNIRPIRAALAD